MKKRFEDFDGLKKINNQNIHGFKKLLWWSNFITTIVMNTVIVILILIGFLFLAYYIDVTKNAHNGKWKPPLYGAYVIVSSSMEPTIHVQDAIVIKRVNNLKIGDVCTYLSRDPRFMGVMITHRIIGTDVDENGNKVYVFKGDSNFSSDTLPVQYDQIYGKVVAKIPKIGYVQYFLSSAYGWIIAIIIPCFGIIGYDVVKIIKSMSETREKKRKRFRDEK